MTTLYCRYCPWRGGSFSHLLTHYAVWHDPQSPFNVRVSPLYDALGMARVIAEDIQEIQKKGAHDERRSSGGDTRP